MKRPKGLGARWGRVWDAARADLDGRGEWDEVSAALLEQMVRNLQEADNALLAAAAEPFTEGSQGQLVAHPGFGVSRGCEAAVLAAARQLRLTPATKGSGDGSGSGREAADPFAAVDELAARRARGRA